MRPAAARWRAAAEQFIGFVGIGGEHEDRTRERTLRRRRRFCRLRGRQRRLLRHAGSGVVNATGVVPSTRRNSRST